METKHVAVIVLIIVGISIAIAGWNGITNTVADSHKTIQGSRTVVDDLADDYRATVMHQPKPNPMTVPFGEIVLGLVLASGGLYLFTRKN